jgi:heat shock protein HslJ
VRLVIVLTVLALGVAGWTGAHPSIDGSWQLVSGEVDGAPVPIVADHRITLTVDGTEFGGRSACNLYGAEVSYGDRSLLNGVSLEITSMFTTEMACEPPVMESEAAYQQALMRVSSASRSAGRLTLSGPNVRLEYEELAPVPQSSMVGTRWVLESLVQGDTVASVQGEPALLELGEDGSLGGSTGCRRVSMARADPATWPCRSCRWCGTDNACSLDIDRRACPCEPRPGSDRRRRRSDSAAALVRAHR